MRAGRLDRRLTILVAREDRNSSNELIETWAELTTVAASYNPVSDGERTRAQETAAVADARFQIRYARAVEDVTPKYRLRFEGRVFNIIGVKEIGRREGIEISAQARAE